MVFSCYGVFSDREELVSLDAMNSSITPSLTACASSKDYQHSRWSGQKERLGLIFSSSWLGHDWDSFWPNSWGLSLSLWPPLLTDRNDMVLVLYSKHALSFQMHWESLGSNTCTRAANTSLLCWWGNQTMGQESKRQMGHAWWFKRTPEGEGQFARQGNLRPCLLLLVYLSRCSPFLGAPSWVTSAGKPCASGSEQSSNAFKDLWVLIFRLHGQKN